MCLSSRSLAANFRLQCLHLKSLGLLAADCGPAPFPFGVVCLVSPNEWVLEVRTGRGFTLERFFTLGCGPPLPGLIALGGGGLVGPGTHTLLSDLTRDMAGL